MICVSFLRAQSHRLPLLGTADLGSYDVTKPFSVINITIEKVQNTHYFLLVNAGEIYVTFFFFYSFVQHHFNKESLRYWNEKIRNS